MFRQYLFAPVAVVDVEESPVHDGRRQVEAAAAVVVQGCVHGNQGAVPAHNANQRKTVERWKTKASDSRWIIIYTPRCCIR